VFVEGRGYRSGDDIRVTGSSDLIDVGDASRKAAYNARICRCADGWEVHGNGRSPEMVQRVRRAAT
jgi:hypothetical protein